MMGEPMFQNAYFIKPDIPFDPQYRGENPAPMFRKSFRIGRVGHAVLSVCGLGIAYCRLNGKRVSDDLFCAPVSNYDRTLWYVQYDVTSLLREGSNTVAVICGNGWFNEEFRSSWDFDRAPWRDLPKCILQLEVDGETVLVTDGTWKCVPYSAVTFNALRSGEYFDATRYDANWSLPEYDDSVWSLAAVDDRPPRGIFRKCDCEPIREHEVYPARSVRQLSENRFLFDIGQNISGYVRLTAKGVRGQELTVRYFECLHPDGTPDFDSVTRFFPDNSIQTDRLICSGEEICWSPMFAYHGFRYVEISGICRADEVTVSGVFVHQAVRPRTTFTCSDAFLNSLFRAGQMSSLSNFFYLVSDCPTREKLGWLNDTQMSCEQFLTDFHAEKLLKKWMVDLRDAMREDGAMSCIVPTAGWGYQWGSGPLSDGALFEIPYRLWIHTGDGAELTETLPYFERYLSYLKSREEADGQVSFGLGDWATAGGWQDVPVPFVNDVLIRKFEQIAALAADLSGKTEDRNRHLANAENRKQQILARWFDADGRAVIPQMTLPAVLLAHGIWTDRKVLEDQLVELVEANGCHHRCGLLGLRCLYKALALCGREDLAYRVITADGYPSYRQWFESGATTLWEHWKQNRPNGDYASKNHHMYSDVLSYLIKSTLGIRHNRTVPNEPEFRLEPYFWSGLDYAQGSYETDNGVLEVDWNREGKTVVLWVTLTGNIRALCRGKTLEMGTHTFQIQEDEIK